MNRRIVVLGGEGQLGQELSARWGPSAIVCSRAQLDLTHPEWEQKLEAFHPECVVNCAAYNHVDAAEDHPEQAFAVNAWGVRRLAAWCAVSHVPLMHISTDHVFGLDRRSTPYREDDPLGPVNVYGASKAAGEWFVRARLSQYWIVRTCGLYSRAASRSKGNFVLTMLKLAQSGREIRVVCDQVCTPTSAADLAEALVELMQTSCYGVYHATNSGSCSWYEFACAILAEAGITIRVQPISSTDYAARAARPAYSVLNCERLQRVLGRCIRPWQEALQEFIHTLPASAIE